MGYQQVRQLKDLPSARGAERSKGDVMGNTPIGEDSWGRRLGGWVMMGGALFNNRSGYIRAIRIDC